MAYATVEQLLKRIPDFQSGDTEAVAAAQALLDEASAYLDGGIRRPSDPPNLEVFHVVTDSDIAATRNFYGGGTSYLLLDPYVGPLAEGAVTVGTGGTLPRYWMEAAGGLLSTDGAGSIALYQNWARGQIFSVSAKWGYTSVPPDVVTAVLDWAQSAYVRSYAENDRDKLPLATQGMERCIERHRLNRAMEAAL